MDIKVTLISPNKWYGFPHLKLEKDIKFTNVTVPKGFVSDGTTISRWVSILGVLVAGVSLLLGSSWMVYFGLAILSTPLIFPRIGIHLPASIAHDYFLRDEKTSRKEADYIFKVCLAELGIPRWQRFCLFLGVRIFSKAKKYGSD